MRTMFTTARKGLVTASVLGALGFGAMQVFARPAAADPPTCNPAQCDKQCKARFGDFAAGYCDPFGGCSCAV